MEEPFLGNNGTGTAFSREEGMLSPEVTPLVEACDDGDSMTTTGSESVREHLKQQQQQQAMSDTVSFIPPDNNIISDTVSFMPTDIKVMSSMHQASYAKMIDNRFINYVAIKLRCGVVAMCRTNVLTLCPSALKSLNQDLTACFEIMPPSVHAFIRRTRVWVNHSYSYGAQDDPRLLRHTTVHHHQAWLIWARDRPDKVNSIEIYDCRDYEKMRWHWNGPGLILHELCHLIHQHCLENGLQNLKVFQAYVAAKNHEEAIYDNTLRRDWAGLDCDTDLAYAMVDHKEFFAEMSVTFLGDNYHELDEEDKTSIERCSPPCLEPSVVKRLQHRKQSITLEEAKVKGIGIPQRQLRSNSIRSSSTSSSTRSDNQKNEEAGCCGALRFFRFLIRCCRPKVAILPPRRLPHCNKFYPFTRGQLRHHDIDTYLAMSELWREIELWDDPLDDRFCGKGLAFRLPFVKQSQFQSI